MRFSTRPTPDPVGRGQESAWDYPRPPRLEPVTAHLVVVLGGVITAMQVSALRTGGVWLNWLVAAIGTAVAVSGLVRLLRAYAKVRSSTN